MLITSHAAYLYLCSRIKRLREDETIAIDTETTGVNLWTTDELRGVCIGFRGESFYVPISHPNSWNVVSGELLCWALEQCAALPLYANAPFDWRSLEAGIGLAPPLDRYRDVQLIAWLEDENRRKGLKYLGELFCGEDAAEEQRALKALFAGETQAAAYKRLRQELHAAGESEGAAATKVRAAAASAASKVSWATITAEQIAPYAAKDADLTARVYEALVSHPEYAEIEAAVETLHRVQASAYRMSRRGVGIDVGKAHELRMEAWARATEIADSFEVNIASAKQLAELVYETWALPVTERTDGGAPSTAAAVLEAMAGDHPGVDQILEYRRLTKAAQFYGALLDHVDTAGRVHTSFKVNGTVTGRWSSSDPNLQQIPKESTNKDAKKLFVARPGYELVMFDLASAELRVAASLAGDTDMMAALDEPGRSFHKETAASVFDSADEPFYTLAKNLNYGIPYGIGPKRFASYIAKGLAQKQTTRHYGQAKAAIDAHRLAWPVLHQAIRNCTEYADLTGRLPLGWPGRIRHFTSASMAWPVPGYQAFNSAVQGGVALFMNDVLLAVEAPAAALGADLLLAVHDEFWFEAPIGTKYRLAEVLQATADAVNPFKLRMLFGIKGEE
jgi:DNA polymerase-1